MNVRKDLKKTLKVWNAKDVINMKDSVWKFVLFIPLLMRQLSLVIAKTMVILVAFLLFGYALLYW